MNIAIVGCGIIARSHLRFLRKFKPEASLSLCDLNYERAKDMAQSWGINSYYDDIDNLLEKDNPFSVHIVTPPSSHALLAEKALQAGSHVFVEKPITETADEFQKLLKIAKKNERILYGDYSTMGMPVVMKAIRLIRSGSLGKLISVECSFAGSDGNGSIPYRDAEHWAYRLRGGILENMIDHPLVLLMSVMEEVDEHHLYVNRRNVLPYDCPDLIHLSLKNENQIGSLTLSLGHGRNERRVTFFFEGGSINLDLGRQLMNMIKGRGPQNFVKKALSGIREGYAMAGGTIGNILLAMCGKLTRDPGIANLMQNYYSVIESGEHMLVNHDLMERMTRLLDDVWDEISYRPTIQLKEQA